MSESFLDISEGEEMLPYMITGILFNKFPFNAEIHNNDSTYALSSLSQCHITVVAYYKSQVCKSLSETSCSPCTEHLLCL